VLQILLRQSSGFGDNPDQFLENSPDAVCDRELNGTIDSLVEKSPDWFIRGKAFNGPQHVVLKYRNGDPGNLSREVPGLGFAQSQQVLCFFEEVMESSS